MHDRRYVPFSLLLAAALLLLPVASHAAELQRLHQRHGEGPPRVAGRRRAGPEEHGDRGRAPAHSTDGEYAFRNLVPGSYELRVNGAGFQPYLQRNIEVGPERRRPPRRRA